MDLIFLDQTRFELGVLDEYALDIDLADQKDFEIKTLTDNKYLLQEKYWWYIDGTEYGGIIDKISHDTESDEIVYTGRNFRGILATRIIEPETNEDFMTVDGNIEDIINLLLTQVGLSDLFVAIPSEIEINQYQFERYTDLYSGIIKMLDTVNCKLKLKYDALDCKCHVGVELVDDFSDYLTYCKENTVNFKISSNKGGVNHLICLGQGELKERYVIHLFTDEYGALQPYSKVEQPMQNSDYILDKSKQVMVGLDEIAEVYDLSNAGITQNYLILTEQPQDWAKNYKDYYKLSDSKDYESYTNVEAVQIYTPLSSEPSDWKSKYQNYYQKEEKTETDPSDSGDVTTTTEYKPVESVILSTTYPTLKLKPSDWNTSYGSYYYRFDDGVEITYPTVSGVSYNVYKKEVRKPSNWASNFGDYYVITKDKKTGKKKYTSVQGIGKKKNKAPSWKKNKYYTKYSKEKAPAFKSGYHRKKVEESGAPTWTANKYYLSEEVAPAWNSGEYYEMVYDNYAELVSGGLDRLESLSNSESQEVTLDDFEADIGDVVGGIDDVTGIELCEKITNMIVTIQNDVVNIEYSIGGDNQ